MSIDGVRATAEPIPQEAAQQRFWNEWNAKNRGAGYDPSVDAPTKRRRDVVLDWVRELGLRNGRVLDLGCATGWLTHQLAEFGEVVGTDIADASICEARQRYPGVRFECEDFSTRIGRSRNSTSSFRWRRSVTSAISERSSSGSVKS